MHTQLYLTPRDRGRPLTLEEFETSASQEGYHYELIDGRLEVMPLPNLPHDSVEEWLAEKLRAYKRQHPEILAEVRAPARVIVPDRLETTAPEPDVAAYDDFRADLPVEQKGWRDVSPILVAEVVSDDNADKDLERNVALYLEVPSIREYWIVDPRVSVQQPSLTVYRRRGQRWQRPILVGSGETYTTRLLPGFSLTMDLQR